MAFEASLVAGRATPVETLSRAGRGTQSSRARLPVLPDHQRVPIVLFHFEDRSYQEIAALLGVSLGKVKTDIHRGRDAAEEGIW